MKRRKAERKRKTKGNETQRRTKTQSTRENKFSLITNLCLIFLPPRSF
jgi:hypothetical protein